MHQTQVIGRATKDVLDDAVKDGAPAEFVFTGIIAQGKAVCILLCIAGFLCTFGTYYICIAIL